MEIRLDILRRKSPADKPYLQKIPYRCEDRAATVAAALSDICSKDGVRDMNGEEVGRIRWECSCLQKKCGACAMVIDGVPRLACGARLSEFEKKGYVRIEPLRKFPPVADLVVDRQPIFDALTKMKVWAETDIRPHADTDDGGINKANENCVQTAYEASRCLQCGCCLEVCPNFFAGEGARFFGMSAAVPASRLIEQLPPSERRELAKAYRKGVYEGCGKSLACRDICPAGIDIERLLVNSNAAVVWKGLFGHGRL